MTSEQQHLIDFFSHNAIPYTWYDHEAVFTVEEATKVASHVPGPACKNLFLKDSKKQLWLLSAVAETKIQLKKLSKFLGAPELRFADAELLKTHLGVEPGSVTPFGLLSDTAHTVRVILDKALFDHDIVSFHPLKNNASITLAPKDLERFIEATGHPVQVVDFSIIE